MLAYDLWLVGGSDLSFRTILKLHLTSEHGESHEGGKVVFDPPPCTWNTSYTCTPCTWNTSNTCTPCTWIRNTSYQCTMSCFLRLSPASTPRHKIKHGRVYISAPCHNQACAIMYCTCHMTWLVRACWLNSFSSWSSCVTSVSSSRGDLSRKPKIVKIE